MNKIQRSQGFKIDVRSMIGKVDGLRGDLNRKVTAVQIKTPCINFTVYITDSEKKTARKLLLWMKDRRVLSSRECCDGCIKSSIESLLKVRAKLVDAQVELHDSTDKGLFLLTEFMLQPLRQFLTWHEKLQKELKLRDEEKWPRDAWDLYFDALNTLREHLKNCLTQIGNIGTVELIEMPENLRPEFGEWSR